MNFIDVDKNLVFIGEEEEIEVDCSPLKDENVSIVFYTDTDKWMERVPFVGEERDVDFTTADSILNEAKQKFPKDVYDKQTGEVKTITVSDPIPTGYSETKTDEALLYEAKQAAHERILESYKNELHTLIGKYSQEEIDGWGQQKMAAESFKKGNTENLITKIANARNITETEMADRILAKSSNYESSYAEATGILHSLQEEVVAASTITECEAINWPE